MSEKGDTMPKGIGRHRQRGAAIDRIAGLLIVASAPLTTPEVAEHCGFSRALVAAELAALERQGWVERHKVAGRPDTWTWRAELGGAAA